MTVEEMLQRMRDPLGAPFFPQVFQVLLLVTWVIHIFFVTLAVGSGAFTVFGFIRKGDNVLRLARTSAQLTTTAVGLGILTGIAPLLFVQVIYDPIWYASNSLTGFWSVTLVFVVAGGYSLAYLFYLKGSRDGRLLWSAIASTLLLCFAGWIMHVLASVSIRPDKWMEWYAPNGIIQTEGVAFRSYNLARLTYLLPLQAGLSLAVALIFYAWYAKKRDDDDPAYFDWVANLGRKLGLVVGPLLALTGLAWGIIEGSEFDVLVPVTLALVVVGLGLTVFFALLRHPAAHAIWALVACFVALLVVAVVREVVRAASLSRFGYVVSDYPYSIDWGSVTLFLVTSIAAVPVIVFLIRVIYQSSKKLDGAPVSEGVTRLGRVATAMLGAWFGFFFCLGIFALVVLK